MLVRLQKLISQAGITSRRKAEALITDGCVTVNGRIVTELGSKADPERDHVKVNGKLLHFQSPSIYLMLNKPDGFITTLSDPEGRPTVMSLIRGVKGRLYPVGRLDYHTEGLLLLTNDGALAHALMHPSSGVAKRYHVKIKGVIDDDQIARLSRGVKLHDGTTAPCTVNKLRLHEKNSWLEVILHEGRYRQVRRMFEAIGRFVIRLRRVGYAGLTLGDLPAGQSRRLTPKEVESLYRVIGRAARRSDEHTHERPGEQPGERTGRRPGGAPSWREGARPGRSGEPLGERTARASQAQRGTAHPGKARFDGKAQPGWRPQPGGRSSQRRGGEPGRRAGTRPDHQREGGPRRGKGRG